MTVVIDQFEIVRDEARAAQPVRAGRRDDPETAEPPSLSYRDIVDAMAHARARALRVRAC